MTESPLDQRIFNDLFQGLALLDLLNATETLRIAEGLEHIQADPCHHQLFRDVAKAIREYEKREAANG
jgi:hypothetical protein